MIESVQQFYLFAEIGISFLGAIILLGIWATVKTHFKFKLAHEIPVKRIDKGLLYFGMAVFVWAILAMMNYFFITESNVLAMFMRNLFSILNSMFLIFGMFYLDNAPEYLYNNRKSTNRILIALASLSVLSLILSMSMDTRSSSIQLGSIPDLLLSAILSWFLGYSLYRTFHNRKMDFLAHLSVFSVGFLFLSQLPEVFFHLNENNTYSYLIKLIAKFSIISMFLVLGTSWVIDIAKTPMITDMKIHFTDWNQVVLSIPSKSIYTQKIEFGKKTTQFNNFLKFALRRKYAPENDMCIEIISGGEIPSHTYLTRIVDNINEILEMDIDNKLERNDLFTFIGQGKYRLRFLPSHIDIDNALLSEFVHNTENQQYKSFAHSQ